MTKPNILATLSAIVLVALPVQAATFPRQGTGTIENGRSTPFTGQWSMGVPEDASGNAVTQFVSCQVPVTIDAVDDNHISYQGRSNLGMDAAIELRAFMERTVWLPLAGGPSYVTVWSNPDRFFLYEIGEMGAADWDQPFIYDRCS